MNISVVIPTYNEEKTIYKLINSILDQTIPPKEILIVDGFSNDGTIDIVRNIIKKNNTVKLLNRKYKCRGSGRNTGIKNASSEFIAFIDAGCYVNKFWLEEFTKHKEYEVIFGSVEPISKNFFELSHKSILLNKKNKSNFIIPSVCSMMLKNNVAKENLFIENKNGEYVVEDLEFISRIQKKNLKISYVVNAKVQWEVDSKFSKLYRRYSEYSFGALRAGHSYGWYNGLLRNIFIYLSIFFLSYLLSYLFLFLFLPFLFLRSYSYINKLKEFKRLFFFKKNILLIINISHLLFIDFISTRSILRFFSRKFFFRLKKIPNLVI